MSRDVVASGASCPRNPGACWHWLHDDFSPSPPSPDFNGKHQEPPDNKRGGSGTEAKKPQRLCPQRRQALPRSGPHPGRGFLWRGLDCGLLGDAGDTWVPGQGVPCVRDNTVLFTKVAGETRGAVTWLTYRPRPVPPGCTAALRQNTARGVQRGTVVSPASPSPVAGAAAQMAPSPHPGS